MRLTSKQKSSNQDQEEQASSGPSSSAANMTMEDQDRFNKWIELLTVAPLEEIELYESKLRQLKAEREPMQQNPSSIKKLALNPATASSFVGSKQNIPCNIAFNGNMFIPLQYPDVVQKFLNTPVDASLKSQATLLIPAGILFSVYPIAIGETGSNSTKSVDRDFKSKLSLFFSDAEGDGSSDNIVLRCDRASLSEYGASFGPATESSVPDFLCHFVIDDRKIPLLLMELKSTVFNMTEPYGQGAVSAANIALLHWRLGVPRDQIAVPLIFSNGMIYQFGWITMVDENLPVASLTSSTLHTSLDDELDTIMTHLARLKSFCYTQASLIKIAIEAHSLNSWDNCIHVNMKAVHFKNVDDIFNRYDDESQSRMYLMKIFSRLAHIEEVVKPIGFARVCENGTERDVLVFPRVDDSFMHGVPSDRTQRSEFMKSFQVLLKRAHNAGVVHMDVYPSNVFWRVNNGRVEIKLIDWDAATLLGGPLTANMKNSIRRNGRIFYPNCHSGDPKCDAWFYYLLLRLPDDVEDTLHGREFRSLMVLFHELVERHLLGDRTSLFVKEFEKWFEESWNA